MEGGGADALIWLSRAEHERRQQTGLRAIPDLRLLNTLMNLPLGIPGPLSDLSASGVIPPSDEVSHRFRAGTTSDITGVPTAGGAVLAGVKGATLQRQPQIPRSAAWAACSVLRYSTVRVGSACPAG